MAVNYAYYYAVIMLDTGMCIEVKDSTNYYDPEQYPEYIAIPEFSDEYLLKYYNQADGKWYLEASFDTEWTPA